MVWVVYKMKYMVEKWKDVILIVVDHHNFPNFHQIKKFRKWFYIKFTSSNWWRIEHDLNTDLILIWLNYYVVSWCVDHHFDLVPQNCLVLVANLFFQFIFNGKSNSSKKIEVVTINIMHLPTKNFAQCVHTYWEKWEMGMAVNFLKNTHWNFLKFFVIIYTIF